MPVFYSANHFFSPGLGPVIAHCPNVCKVRVVHNVFEHNYSSGPLDECLRNLADFPTFSKNALSLEVDMSCFNLLFAIQVKNKTLYML